MAGDASQLVNTKQVNSLQCTTIGSLFAASSRFLVSFSISYDSSHLIIIIIIIIIIPIMAATTTTTTTTTATATMITS